MNDMNEVPAKVAEVLEAFAAYLQGRGPAPEFDELDDDTLDLVDELLPAIAELVGDRIVDHDGTTALATTRIDGARLRAAREALALSRQELAVRISATGRTVGATNIEAIEGTIDAAVDPALADALAEALAVSVEDLAPVGDDPTRAILEDVKWGHPAADIRHDPIVATAEIEPLVRLVATDFGLVVRIIGFDTADVTDLRGDPYLETVRELAGLDGGATSWFLLVATRDADLATQPVHVSDLRDVVRVPTGDRVQRVGRHPLVLHDAVTFAFEEVSGAVWDDDADAEPVSMDFDTEELAAVCAALGVASATKSRPRTEAKREGVSSVASDEATTLARLLFEVSDARLQAGVPFRDAFNDELVGAA